MTKATYRKKKKNSLFEGLTVSKGESIMAADMMLEQ